MTLTKLKNLWSHLSRRRRFQFLAGILLMIISSFAEMLSLSAVVPFLGMLTMPEQVYQHPYMAPVNDFFNIVKPSQLLTPLTILFVSAALFAGLVRVILLYFITRIAYATGADISVSIYRRTLYQNYEHHLSTNSSEVIAGIIQKTNTVIGGIVYPILNLISGTVIFASIITTLMIINPSIALTAMICIGLLYGGVILYTRRTVNENSISIANQSTKLVGTLQEGLGGIREVLIDGTQELYSSIFHKADVKLRRAMGDNVFIQGSPRFVLEALGMSLIALLAYSMLEENSTSEVIPILGVLALGAQRLLPILQQLYQSYSAMKGSAASFDDVLALLNQPIPAHSGNTLIGKISFRDSIGIKNLSFKYKGSDHLVLKNLNLNIKKGAVVGFVGETGCGKSTLLDLIMGLLQPSEGTILIDEQPISETNFRSWQSHISHVPQTIYLSDSTIRENIAFGVLPEHIDIKRVIKVAKQAHIHQMIEGWHDKYDTQVGERGVRLSGGQRQRIGIARALYKHADVIIFDEATSALDNDTENAVMREIESLGDDITVLIIAHRLSTLKKCDHVYELSKDGLVVKNPRLFVR